MYENHFIPEHLSPFKLLSRLSGVAMYSYLHIVQYTLANPSSYVPMIEKIVWISEFVPISEITLILWGINYNKRASLACTAWLADTLCPPEAPWGRND